MTCTGETPGGAPGHTPSPAARPTLRGARSPPRAAPTSLEWFENSARYGDDPTIILDPSQMIARMTPDHVKAAAKRFLDGKRVYRAILLPGKDAAKPEPGKAPGKEPAKAPSKAPAKAPAKP